jgi:hypothetical protein
MIVVNGLLWIKKCCFANLAFDSTKILKGRFNLMTDDLLNSLLDSSDDDAQRGGLSELLGAANAASGDESALGGIASLLGGGDGDLGGMLGALAGGGGPGGMLGGLMGGSGGADFSQMPIVGPIISTLAEKFGIPPAQASALVTSALTMLLAQKNRSGASRMDEIDIDGMLDEAPQQSDIIVKAAQETGLDETQVAEGVQDALRMLAEAAQGQ